MEELQREYEFEGCCKLVAALLKQTYKDYKRALIYTYLNKQFYLDHIDEVNAYQSYVLDRSEYCRLKNLHKKKYRQNEIEYMQYFESLPVVKRPKRHITTVVNTYINQKNVVTECESFYLSKDYQIFTMGKSKPAIEIINEIRNKAAKVIRRRMKI